MLAAGYRAPPSTPLPSSHMHAACAWSDFCVLRLAASQLQAKSGPHHQGVLCEPAMGSGAKMVSRQPRAGENKSWGGGPG